MTSTRLWTPFAICGKRSCPPWRALTPIWIPVSYTHLPKAFLYGGRSLHGRTLLPVAGCHYYFHYTIPVSYTHLDVYKRQERGTEYGLEQVYNVIDFVSRLENVSPKEAALSLIHICFPYVMENGVPCFVRHMTEEIFFLYPVSYTHLDVYKRQDADGANHNGEPSKAAEVCQKQKHSGDRWFWQRQDAVLL